MRQKQHQSGYTLIDLVLSLAIIGILSGIVVANLHRGKVYGDLVVGAQRLSNSIRQMQTFALNSRVDQCVSDELCAWGVVFYPGQDRYRLFEDWLQSHLPAHRGIYNDQELYQEPVVFPAGITIGSISAVTAAGASVSLNNRAHITFLPPDPEIMICGQNHTQCGFVELEITLTNGSDDRVLIINKFGLIDVIQ